MKRKLLLNAILLFGLFFLFGCRSELLDNQNENSHNHSELLYLRNHTNYSDFVAETNMDFSSKLTNDSKKNNLLVLDSFIIDNFIINMDEIMFTMNQNNQPTTYSFFIASKKNEENNVFYNLIFLKKKTGEWIYRVLKYTPNEVYQPNHFHGDIEELFDSEKISKKTIYSKTYCYYQILTSGGTCQAGHKTLADCGGNVNCCANCWTVFETAMLHCDIDGFEYPSDGGGIGINDGNGSGGGIGALYFGLDANYRTKFSSLNQEIKNYLIQNYEYNQDLNFSKWGIDFFVQKPNTTWAQFENWFITDIPNDFIQKVILENPANILDYVTLSSPDFKMRSLDQIKYPKFTQMVKGLKSYVQNNPIILNKLIEISGMTYAQILDKLTFGQGPQIELIPGLKDATDPANPVDCYGLFSSATPNVLYIREDFALGLQQATLHTTADATNFLLAVTILHEFVHYGNYLTGTNPINGTETGVLFENEVYKMVITKNTAGKYIQQFINK
ncbi:hypothetical protein QGN23_03820 [Chryseobacterium gotjawalense]|uniref:Tox-MPTase3 domain-containing protein n=1 Tax=Chryseobacterium gotjawalense TaxID=3042315 RepID=A0ABY8RFE5_9FLAO|nr:hypothetical protein [Chryseobacterium sp. wdc7]WHF52414.1 hypothetical protein QGN23_03820 [Chryseobacterium sp. wdc7]